MRKQRMDKVRLGIKSFEQGEKQKFIRVSGRRPCYISTSMKKKKNENMTLRIHEHRQKSKESPDHL
jgi:hypothetical protein